ncbi:hypothetical protein NP493_43g07000 [Ridgeia piscesae]|uniref:Uncharacterized protein n=1 Tax=Ridgeia piscesae TaxID=27915 RepID=A0AAD9UJR4_RIDPI|nr:hypothetical protein NP493_43g07000 [Ridgeia piscesae]
MYFFCCREVGCYTCILMKQRHRNILQFKESYCVGKDNFYKICSQIGLQTLLHVLIREPGRPTTCPFRDAFHFSYNNNTGGFCRDPTSYVKPCASDAKFRFHFKHCPHAAYTHNTEVDLECLATWKDLPDQQFMVARLRSRSGGIMPKEARYRCFMYRSLGTLVYVAMSGDASCRGLRSPRDGPLVMEFTKDSFGWPHPSCTFPTWISDTTWRDLSGKHLYQVDASAGLMRMSYRQHLTSEPEAQRAYRCAKGTKRRRASSEFTMLSFSSHGCASKYQCLKFTRRKDGVIQLEEGRVVDPSTQRCHNSDFQNTTGVLLIPEGLTKRACMLPGRYAIHTATSLCASYFRSGCNGSSVLDIVSSCSSKPGLQLECLKSWREGRKTYVIARKLGDKSGMANCFSFIYTHEEGGKMQFAIDSACNSRAQSILRDRVTYVLEDKPLDCRQPRKVTKDVSNNRNKGDAASQRDEPTPTHTKLNKEDPRVGGTWRVIDDSPEHNAATVAMTTTLHVITWTITCASVCITWAATANGR